MTITGKRLQEVARNTANRLPGVGNGRPFAEKLDVYKVAGKVFLIVTDDPDEQIITVKVEPDHARSLRQEHESIAAGRYLDKRHWVSVSAGRDITAGEVKDLVAHSYDLVLESVPRNRRPQGKG
ncbi:MmcQ/YjbR family DNA-binding protein [Allostreptomyces psammosilenae]|uniref:Putative DNA-binding protein (MmcQ/YjbR family) n=1 Tax=Allostreptomyces psammosilenae TaxID=1892865 RepID=A0A852ZUX3_9ACTN|nr:MmcQ/YjbR family DNA-binding protein [Allostreptomyces psammosilenae]NYI04574.1 putative DNA-binding protein (MmcQ/YjbR family) [Allostreptomyces psammosilenae]